MPAAQAGLLLAPGMRAPRGLSTHARSGRTAVVSANADLAAAPSSGCERQAVSGPGARTSSFAGAISTIRLAHARRGKAGAAAPHLAKARRTVQAVRRRFRAAVHPLEPGSPRVVREPARRTPAALADHECAANPQPPLPSIADLPAADQAYGGTALGLDSMDGPESLCAVCERVSVLARSRVPGVATGLLVSRRPAAHRACAGSRASSSCRRQSACRGRPSQPRREGTRPTPPGDLQTHPRPTPRSPPR